MNKNYRPIFLATLQTVGLFAAGFVIPLIGQILALFTPVPVIIVYVRNGAGAGFVTLAAASIVVAVLGGWPAAALFVLSFGLMAVGASEGLRRQLRPEQTALLGGLLPVAALGVILAFYVSRSGANPLVVLEDYLLGSVAEAAKVYTKMGLSEMATMASAVSDTFIHYLVRLIPGITIATSVAQAACCYGVARALILRKPSETTAFPEASLVSWHAPDSWVWGLIATLAVIAVPRETPRIVGWNLAILCATAYLAQGLAIVEFYLRKARLKAFVRGLIVALLLALPSIVFVIALGIVDIWADFRKVRGPAQAV